MTGYKYDKFRKKECYTKVRVAKGASISAHHFYLI